MCKTLYWKRITSRNTKLRKSQGHSRLMANIEWHLISLTHFHGVIRTGLKTKINISPRYQPFLLQACYCTGLSSLVLGTWGLCCAESKQSKQSVRTQSLLLECMFSALDKLIQNPKLVWRTGKKQQIKINTFNFLPHLLQGFAAVLSKSHLGWPVM